MPTTATSNYGMTYTFNGSSIGSCKIIEYPEVSTGVIEITNHAGGGVAEFIPSGVLTLGQLTLSVILSSSSNVTTLDTAIDNKTVANSVIGNGVNTATFSSFVQSVKIEPGDATGPEENRMTVVIQPTGTITWS